MASVLGVGNRLLQFAAACGIGARDYGSFWQALVYEVSSDIQTLELLKHCGCGHIQQFAYRAE